MGPGPSLHYSSSIDGTQWMPEISMCPVSSLSQPQALLMPCSQIYCREIADSASMNLNSYNLVAKQAVMAIYALS